MLVVEYETNTPILRAASQAVPEMAFTLVEEQARADGQVRLLLWATGDSTAAFEAAVEDDATVGELEVLVDNDDRRLYRLLLTADGMQWTTYHMWVNLDGSLMQSRLQDGTWSTRMQLPSRAAIQEYRQWYTEQGLAFDLVSVWVREPTPDGPGIPELTDQQAATFRRAVEAGYYDIPRQTSTADLADEFDISEQAVIERLRRATKALGEHVRRQRDETV